MTDPPNQVNNVDWVIWAKKVDIWTFFIPNLQTETEQREICPLAH